MSPIPLRVLILEDQQTDADLIKRTLRRAGFTPECRHIDNETEYLRHLQPDLDVILADYTLPQFSAPQALALLRDRGLDIPFIVVTGSISEEAAVACIKQGAADYLLKDRLTRLGPAVEHALEEKKLRNAKREAERALQRSEAYYRSLIENTSDIIAVLDQAGSLRYISPSSERVLGYPGNTLMGENGLALVHHEDETLARNAFAQALQLVGIAQTVELRLRHHNGSWRFFEVIGKYIVDEPDDGALIANFRDITERKRHEFEQQIIVTLSTALRSAVSRTDVVTILLDQILSLLLIDGIALVTLHPVNDTMIIEVARGLLAMLTDTQIICEQGMLKQVIAKGQIYQTNRAMRNELCDTFAAHCEAQAVAYVPLTPQEYTIGALILCRTSAFQEEDVHLLRAIGDLAANAINRAELHEQTVRRAQHLVALHAIDAAITASLDLRLTLNIVLDQTLTHLSVDAADILLLNPHTHMLEYTVGRGFRSEAVAQTRLRLGQGLAGRAALDRRIINIANLSEVQDNLLRPAALSGEYFVAYYAVPLIAKGQVKGVLELFHRRDMMPDYDWHDFLQAIATQTAIAIDSTELFTQLQRSNTELALAYEATLEGWVKALDMRDKETEGHTQRVTKMTIQLARMLGISEEEIVHIRRGALLHDIGKMAIPDGILLKAGPLTESEWAIMRKHPVYAYEWLAPISFLHPALDIPYYHHEKWDGSGYPHGLTRDSISLPARIFAVVDVWDALSSDRPYRRKWPMERIIAHIQALSGSHFDPHIAHVFLQRLPELIPENGYYTNSKLGGTG